MRKIYIFIVRASLCLKSPGKVKCLDALPSGLAEVKERAEVSFQSLFILSLSEIKLEWLKRRSRLILTLLWLGFTLSLHAQSSSGVVPLKVGDKLPAAFWQQKHLVYQQGDTSVKTLEAYKGKLIILDFWASWCGPCIHGFPLLQELQRKYPTQLRIMSVNAAVTHDGFEKVDQLFRGKLPPFKTYSHASIINDVYLKALFSAKTIPRYIWIDENGRLIAITGEAFVNATSIDNLLNQPK